MNLAMPHDPARCKVIEATMKAQKERGDRLPTAKLVIQGQARNEPAFRFRLNDLLFNPANGRVRSEVLAEEAKLLRAIDPYSQQDQHLIKKLLLAIRPDENEKIREDLAKNGQLTYGIVTCDGILINGNRRKAILEELYAKTSEEKYQYFEAQVLPKDVTRKEVWLIEAGIQLSAPQQLDYSPVNNLLKLREGVSSGVTIADMARRIYGADESKLREDLERLELIDLYLTDFVKKPKRYYLVQQLHEHFIDLQNILSWAKRPRGAIRKDWKTTESDTTELMLVAFHYIRGRFSHWRIRELRNIFARQSSWKKVRNITLQEGEGSREQERPVTLEDETEPAAEDEEGEATEPSTDVTMLQDQREEKQWERNHSETLKRNYEDAREELQIEQSKERPLDLADRALRNLKAIHRNSPGFSNPKMDDILRQIVVQANQLRKVYMKGRSKAERLVQRGKRPLTPRRESTPAHPIRQGKKR